MQEAKLVFHYLCLLEYGFQGRFVPWITDCSCQLLQAHSKSHGHMITSQFCQTGEQQVLTGKDDHCLGMAKLKFREQAMMHAPLSARASNVKWIALSDPRINASLPTEQRLRHAQMTVESTRRPVTLYLERMAGMFCSCPFKLSEVRCLLISIKILHTCHPLHPIFCTFWDEEGRLCPWVGQEGLNSRICVKSGILYKLMLCDAGGSPRQQGYPRFAGHQHGHGEGSEGLQSSPILPWGPSAIPQGSQDQQALG